MPYSFETEGKQGNRIAVAAGQRPAATRRSEEEEGVGLAVVADGEDGLAGALGGVQVGEAGGVLRVAEQEVLPGLLRGCGGVLLRLDVGRADGGLAHGGSPR